MIGSVHLCSVHVRSMEEEDLDTVAALEAEICYSPWSRQVFQDCLSHEYEGWLAVAPPLSGETSSATGPVLTMLPSLATGLFHGENDGGKAAHRDEIAAYGMLSVVCDEGHLLNLGVAAHWRRQGLGQRLAEHMIERAHLLGAQVLFLEVRASNGAAQALYKKLGFYQIGLRKNYYKHQDGKEDAFVFSLRLKPEEISTTV